MTEPQPLTREVFEKGMAAVMGSVPHPTHIITTRGTRAKIRYHAALVRIGGRISKDNIVAFAFEGGINRARLSHHAGLVVDSTPGQESGIV